MRAAALVRTGRVHDLAHVLDEHVPAFPGRTFRQYLTTSAHQTNRRGPRAGRAGLGRNDVNWIVEYVSAPSQIGTHMDGLNHLQIGDRTYNGHRLDDIVEQHGTNRLGVETLPQVVTRGVLLDVGGGVRRWPAATCSPRPTRARGAGARRRQRRAGRRRAVPHRLGPAVGRRQRPPTSRPNPGPAWRWPSGWSSTGSRSPAATPGASARYPPEDPDEPFVVPQTLNTHHGVVVLENLRLADAAAAGLTEFLFVVSHAKLRGATGAWVAPLAIT